MTLHSRFALILIVCILNLGAGTEETLDLKAKDPFVLTPLKNNLYAISAEGANIVFFVGPESVLVVDSHYRQLGNLLVDRIRRVTDKPIKYLVNTHYHGDHVGANDVFLRSGALIIGHKNCRTGVLGLPQDILQNYPQIVKDLRQQGAEEKARALEEEIEWAKNVKPEQIPAPSITFDNQLEIHLEVETVHLWHATPSHTDGDVIVYFEKNKVLHTGDLFVNKIMPFIDVSTGGSVSGYAQAIGQILKRISAETIIVPGHGEISDVAGLKQFRQYFQELMASAERAKSSGMSKEEFLKELNIPICKEWKYYSIEVLQQHASLAYDEINKSRDPNARSKKQSNR